LAKLIILIANRFCGMLCRGILQTPIINAQTKKLFGQFLSSKIFL
jgi:hypothetical protein